MTDTQNASKNRKVKEKAGQASAEAEKDTGKMQEGVREMHLKLKKITINIL